MLCCPSCCFCCVCSVLCVNGSITFPTNVVTQRGACDSTITFVSVCIRTLARHFSMEFMNHHGATTLDRPNPWSSSCLGRNTDGADATAFLLLILEMLISSSRCCPAQRGKQDTGKVNKTCTPGAHGNTQSNL